jgi:hypothetical protein
MYLFWGAAPSPAKEPFLKKGSLESPKTFNKEFKYS